MKKQTETEQKIVFPDSYYVLSADLSMRRPGFCILFVDKDIVKTISTSYVDNKDPKQTRGEMLNRILHHFISIIPSGNDKIFFVREKAFNSRAAQSEIAIYEVVGLMDWAIFERKDQNEWIELYPASVKKLVTGSGKAKKQEVAKALENYVGKQNYEVDDESDALAVAISFLIKNGIIESKPLPEYK